ncbi:uncharacterized protein LOC119973485 isoform X2 [Scyliorhinus canicula]|uniref:uncharacterized protein LOC119973485 isoform X2 n=1 Tax=Scyliorhinus canicula TaxID=7830 RepID=UPI0018F66939|nr:uncharacterized protein LOC119973485 isoform X2 [Scyliorhinus canicula]
MDTNTMMKTHMLIVSILITRFTPVLLEGNLCSGGHDLYIDIKENSPNGTFIAKLTVNGNPSTGEINLNLTGTDMEWFRLEEKVVKLNVWPTRQLDRELLTTPLLFAMIICTDVASSDQIHYRLMVQILDENDNPPIFLKKSVQPLNVSELTPVGDVLFTLQAHDKDGDDLIYMIDSTSSDARFFKINLPSSGQVLLAQHLDFELKKELDLMVYALEINTKERYNTSVEMTISVLDGDDQYPRFLPCHFLSHGGARICVNPVYTGNVTETKLPFRALQLSPGPILAEDGDMGLQTAIIYSILEGDDNGRFEINNVTGAIMMRWPVRSYAQTPSFSLTIMASQVDDPSKYTVTKVLIHVFAQNRHRPRFNKIEYKGFVQEQSNPLALVVTYGNKPLLVKAVDQDFKNGRNPNLIYALKHQSNHTQLFQVTQDGLLLARTDWLHAHEKYMLQIVGSDNESGDVVSTRVNIEILHSSQPVPSGLSKESRKYSSKEMGLLGGIIGILLLFLATAFVLLTCHLRHRHRQHRQRGTVAAERNTNVVNTSKPEQSYSNLAYINEGFSDCNEESTCNQRRIPRELLDAAPVQEPECAIKPILTNGKPVQIPDCKSMCIKADVMSIDICTDAGNQCSECKNEDQNCPLGVNLQLSDTTALDERPQCENKKEPFQFTKETVQDAAVHSGTTPGEIKVSTNPGKQDWKTNTAGEQKHSVSTAGGLERLVTADGQMQSVSEAEQENPVAPSRGQEHIACLKREGAANSVAITKHATNAQQPATAEHPSGAKQPATEVAVEHPVELLYPASMEHPVEEENLAVEHPVEAEKPVALVSPALTEVSVTVQHQVEMENPMEMGNQKQTEEGEMAVGYPAATEYSVTEGVVLHCPTTGVTIEVLEGVVVRVEATAARKTSVQTSAVVTDMLAVAGVVTKCPGADVGIERLVAGELDIEGQSAIQMAAENPATGGSGLWGPEGETLAEGQMEARESPSAGEEAPKIVNVGSAPGEISPEATGHLGAGIATEYSVAAEGSTATDYSTDAAGGESSVTPMQSTANIVVL